MTDSTVTTIMSTNNHNISASSAHKRLCWVCFGTEQDDEDLDVVWVCPCQCKGTMKWVHEECLQRWVDEKQKRTNSMRVTCSQCKTHYILTFPPVNRFVRLIEQYDKLLYGSSPFVAVSIVLGSIYLCCCSYGFISIIQVLGHDEGRRLIDEADPLLLIIGLPVIPVGLILAKLIKWEDFILRLWRKSAFSLPRPLSYIFDKPPLKPRANCDQLLLDPGFNEPLGCTRMICGALLLPTVSTLLGKIFFSQMDGPQWRKSLLGGLAFVLIKGALKIYLRKSQYVRYSQRSIKNYVPSARTSGGTTGGSSPGTSGPHPGAGSDHYGDGGDDSNDALLVGDDSLDFGSLQTVDSRLLRGTSSDNLAEDSSDDEEHQPRTRTMFSMTISLGR